MLDWIPGVAGLVAWYDALTPTEVVWLAIGFGGQSMFMMRFLVQWIVTEKARRSVVPEMFWYFSLLGGATMMAYGIHRADPVIIVGQSTGVFIYLRNLYFIWQEKGRFTWRSAGDRIAAAPVEEPVAERGAGNRGAGE